MQACDLCSGDDADGHRLGDERLAVVPVGWRVGDVVSRRPGGVCGCSCEGGLWPAHGAGLCDADDKGGCAGGRLGQADAGAGYAGAVCGAQSSQKRSEWDFEIDGVVGCGGLDGVGGEEGVNG